MGRNGSVRPEGLELDWLDLPHLEGSGTRMLNYYDFDASEISLSSFTIAKTVGKPLVGIPVFRVELSGIPIFLSTRTAAFESRKTSWEKGRSGRVPADRDRLGQRHFAARVRCFS